MSDLNPILVNIDGDQRYKRLLSGVPSTKGIKSGYVILKSGESVGEHKTDNREEVIIILEGQADIYCEGKCIFPAQKDNLIYIPPETNHDIKNTGKNNLRYIYVVASI